MLDAGLFGDGRQDFFCGNFNNSRLVFLLFSFPTLKLAMEDDVSINSYLKFTA
ncbi:hypothetical protein PEDI_21920 [Persicobacter diffluens]|uniref:Uncharacterized protein n=1 Tax=Persicobacter diffluens TaxID=981 RepID=A0AAN4W0E4_9BACT|nr:hypothetical protein PEDI_21920 [Persicobacter diffluens]